MEKYKVSLNYEGNDYDVVVDDLETANLLLNDVNAAAQFLETNLPDNQLSSVSNENTETVVGADIIWSKKKPTEIDLEATSLLLTLREEFDVQFMDKKSRKSKLWADIASIIQKTYNLGPNGAEKCRQKFANLQKTYLGYVRHQKTTGTARHDDIPPFFEQLHSILGDKHKVNPKRIEDSIEVENEELENTECNGEESQTLSEVGEESEQDGNQKNMREATHVASTSSAANSHNYKKLSTPAASTSEGCSDRFKKGRRTVTPSRQEEILKEIQKERENRYQEFQYIKKHLQKSETQTERFLEILEKAFGTKKRRREPDTSDSD